MATNLAVENFRTNEIATTNSVLNSSIVGIIHLVTVPSVDQEQSSTVTIFQQQTNQTQSGSSSQAQPGSTLGDQRQQTEQDLNTPDNGSQDKSNKVIKIIVPQKTGNSPGALALQDITTQISVADGGLKKQRDSADIVGKFIH